MPFNVQGLDLRVCGQLSIGTFGCPTPLEPVNQRDGRSTVENRWIEAKSAKPKQTEHCALPM